MTVLSLRLRHRHPVKPKEIFNLAVRLLGLIFLYHGLREAPLFAAAITTAVRGVHSGGPGRTLSFAAGFVPLTL